VGDGFICSTPPDICCNPFTSVTCVQ
jgi:hypothetical protein